MRTHTFTTSAATFPLHAIDPRGFTPWAHEPDEFDREQDEDDDTFDCLMGPDGQCGAASSGECEFDCPTMRDRPATPDFSEVCDDE